MLSRLNSLPTLPDPPKGTGLETVSNTPRFVDIDRSFSMISRLNSIPTLADPSKGTAALVDTSELTMSQNKALKRATDMIAKLTAMRKEAQ